MAAPSGTRHIEKRQKSSRVLTETELSARLMRAAERPITAGARTSAENRRMLVITPGDFIPSRAARLSLQEATGNVINAAFAKAAKTNSSTRAARAKRRENRPMDERRDPLITSIPREKVI